MKNVVLFGYGKMGASIAKGWKDKKLNFNFIVVEKEVILRNKALNDGFKVLEKFSLIEKHNEFLDIDIIFLAVKPQQMKDLLKDFHNIDISSVIFISIAAGLSFSWFKHNYDPNIKIIRAMPNLPASVRRGVTGYCKSKNIEENDEKDVITLLNSFGKVIYLDDEAKIDIVTAISGSGPAYIFYLVEVLYKIAINQGILKSDAKVLALETLLGSANLLDQSELDPEILRDQVTSPGGTTEAGLKILMSGETGLYDLFNSTIINAKKRALELNSNS